MMETRTGILVQNVPLQCPVGFQGCQFPPPPTSTTSTEIQQRITVEAHNLATASSPTVIFFVGKPESLTSRLQTVSRIYFSQED